MTNERATSLEPTLLYRASLGRSVALLDRQQQLDKSFSSTVEEEEEEKEEGERERLRL